MFIKNLLSPLSKVLKKRNHYYRYFHARYYALQDTLLKKSYSQFGEDQIVYDYLCKKGFLNKEWIYIDVGSNHPTVINDTFLFYKKGFRGICIEPNLELAQFFHLIRPNDIMISAAAGERSGIVKFYQTDNPLFSSTIKEDLEDNVEQVYFVPMVTLDDILKEVKFDVIFFLKIDTEGHDLSVLKGTTNNIPQIMIIQSEVRNNAVRTDFLSLLGNDWAVLHSNNCNTIFINSKLINNRLQPVI